MKFTRRPKSHVWFLLRPAAWRLTALLRPSSVVIVNVNVIVIVIIIIIIIVVVVVVVVVFIFVIVVVVFRDTSLMTRLTYVMQTRASNWAASR